MVEAARYSVDQSLFKISPDRYKTPVVETPAERYLNHLFGIDCRSKAEQAINNSEFFGETELKLPLFKNPPGRHWHKNELSNGEIIEAVSPGLYLVEAVIGNHKVLLSYFPADEDATGHHHLDGVIEHYFPIGGDSHLRLDDEVIDFRDKKGFTTVNEKTWHQFTTKLSSSPALTLLIMENAGSIAPEKLHVLGHPITDID